MAEQGQRLRRLVGLDQRPAATVDPARPYRVGQGVRVGAGHVVAAQDAHLGGDPRRQLGDRLAERDGPPQPGGVDHPRRDLGVGVEQHQPVVERLHLRLLPGQVVAVSLVPRDRGLVDRVRRRRVGVVVGHQPDHRAADVGLVAQPVGCLLDQPHLGGEAPGQQRRLVVVDRTEPAQRREHLPHERGGDPPQQEAGVGQHAHPRVGDVAQEPVVEHRAADVAVEPLGRLDAAVQEPLPLDRVEAPEEAGRDAQGERVAADDGRQRRRLLRIEAEPFQQAARLFRGQVGQPLGVGLADAGRRPDAGPAGHDDPQPAQAHVDPEPVDPGEHARFGIVAGLAVGVGGGAVALPLLERVQHQQDPPPVEAVHPHQQAGVAFETQGAAAVVLRRRVVGPDVAAGDPAYLAELVAQRGEVGAGHRSGRPELPGHLERELQLGVEPELEAVEVDHDDGGRVGVGGGDPGEVRPHELGEHRRLARAADAGDHAQRHRPGLDDRALGELAQPLEHVGATVEPVAQQDVVAGGERADPGLPARLGEMAGQPAQRHRPGQGLHGEVRRVAGRRGRRLPVGGQAAQGPAGGVGGYRGGVRERRGHPPLGGEPRERVAPRRAAQGPGPAAVLVRPVELRREHLEQVRRLVVVDVDADDQVAGRHRAGEGRAFAYPLGRRRGRRRRGATRGEAVGEGRLLGAGAFRPGGGDAVDGRGDAGVGRARH